MKLVSHTTGQDDIFFPNISANVGPNSPNRAEDVQLVQFGYFALAQVRDPENSPDLIAAAGAVVPGAPYSGAPNDPLTLAIQAHERFRGGMQDGHVSIIRAGGIYDGTHVFLLVRLVNNILDMMKDDWPRIDKHPKCPPALAASMKRTLLLK